MGVGWREGEIWKEREKEGGRRERKRPAHIHSSTYTLKDHEEKWNKWRKKNRMKEG